MKHEYEGANHVVDSIFSLDTRNDILTENNSRELQNMDNNGLEELSFYISRLHNNGNDNVTAVVQKFDTAASSCMSAIDGRIVSASQFNPNVRIYGFNNSTSRPTQVGLNVDNKKEYLVPHMPKQLVLLCGHAYASDGAAILTKDGGMIIKLDENELEQFLAFASQYPILKRLKVRNNTYEIDDSIIDSLPSDDDDFGYAAEELSYMSQLTDDCAEFVYSSNTATKHFNTKVHLSNNSEVVFMLLMMGLSLNDWYKHVKNGSLGGIPPSVTPQLLNNFVHKHGKTPDIIRLAIPIIPGNRSGLMDPPEELVRRGQRVELDGFDSDYNEIDKSSDDGKVRKLETHGGAVTSALAIDCWSGYSILHLLKAPVNSVKLIEKTVDEFDVFKVRIELLAADQGVLSQSKFQVMKPAAVKRCEELGIQIEVSEPYNHSRGTATVERTIRTIKELGRMAMLVILRNPNFHTLGFTKLDILKLWGEVFKWAVVISNLKPSQRDPTKSKYELFVGKKPNMQNIRLLPIFSVIFILRNAEALSSSHQMRRVIALYVGPAMNTPGAIRAVYKTGDRVEITRTSRITSTSDGGGLNVYRHVEKGTTELIAEQNKNMITEGNFNNNNTSSTTDVNQPATTIIPFAETDNSICDKHDISSADHSNLSSPTAPIESPSPRGVSRVDRRRSDRIKLLEQKRKELISRAEEIEEFACFADWCNHDETSHYYSYHEQAFFAISEEQTSEKNLDIEEVCRAVTANVPKSFSEALEHPVWGDAARAEFNTLITTKAIVEVSSDDAKSALNTGEADLVILFPVYEAKMRDGEIVYKVRLVGNGKTHYGAGHTYAATPSREELLILLHIIALFNWEYVHIDEKRAFLSAMYNGGKPVYTKLQGRANSTYYQVLGALYGLKTSPKDYQEKVSTRFEALGYKRLTMCTCIYIISTEEHLTIVYVFVDDFIFTGSNRAEINRRVEEFRLQTATTEPDWNAKCLLGVEVERIRDYRAICCTFTSKIEEAVARFADRLPVGQKHIPIPMSQYIIRPEDLDELSPERASFLSTREREIYMSIVGMLIWISGIRMDILFAVMYLSWATKNPRHHHFLLALQTLAYLNTTKRLPLVLGGDIGEIDIIAQSDASLGTAPKGRSVIGHMVALGPKAGQVTAKCSATATVMTSSFEAELDGAATGIKSSSRVKNAILELRQQLRAIPRLCCDNKALVSWLQGHGVVKAVRHMELRQYYIREKIKRGDSEVFWGPGNKLTADGLTKPKDRQPFVTYAYQLMGHALLSGYEHEGIIQPNTNTEEEEEKTATSIEV